MAQVYKPQKAAGRLPMKSDKQVTSADGYLGYAIYGNLSEGDEKLKMGVFTRPSGK